MNHQAYLEMEGVSASLLKDVLISPHRAMWRLQNRKDSAAFAFGRAFHTAVLEPALFEERHPVYSGTRRGKAWEAFKAGVLNPEDIITENELLQIVAMRDALMENKVAASLLEAVEKEQTFTWEENGVACKARLDGIGSGVLLDLKTCRDASPHFFRTDAAKYNYYLQVAWYRRAAVVNDVPVDNVYIIACSKDEPHDAVVHHVPAHLLDYGWGQAKQAFNSWVDAVTTGVYRRAHEGVQTLDLPHWKAEEE